MSRSKLAKLKSKVKPKDPPNTGVIMDAYVERDGPHLRVYTRSHILAKQLPAWMKKERTYHNDDGEELGTVDGWWAVQQYYPGAETYEIIGPHVDLEVTRSDKIFREVAEDPQIQEIMKVLGGTLVSVKPAKKRRKRVKTD